MLALLNPADRINQTQAHRRVGQGCCTESFEVRRQHLQLAWQSTRLFRHTVDCYLPSGLSAAFFA